MKSTLVKSQIWARSLLPAPRRPLGGTLRIHQSGRVVLQIGDILFNVDQGSECQFAQDIAVVCPREKEVRAF